MPKAELFLICTILVELSAASNGCSNEKPWLCRKGGTLDDPFLFRRLRDEHILYIIHPLRPIPEQFDAREKWPECESIGKIRNQGVCGTCWAFVTATTASDRLCIHSNGTNEFQFSVQEIITCCDDCYFKDENETLCVRGGIVTHAIAHLIDEGCVSEECKPYNIEELESGCKETCVNDTISYKDNKSKMKFLRAALNVTDDYRNVQIEIMEYGPVYARLHLPLDFHDYIEGVYVETEFSNETSGLGHAIKLIGWGTENGVPYWLCGNSWGTDWGKLGGFVKIRRGTNELGIESKILAPSMDTEKPDTDMDFDVEYSAAHVFHKQRLIGATAVTVSYFLLNYNFYFPLY